MARTICPYCDIEVSESSIEAEDGCCPECGAALTASSLWDGEGGDDDFEEEDELFNEDFEEDDTEDRLIDIFDESDDFDDEDEEEF
jgi:hypothetical protein